MDFDQLETFNEVAKHLSFSRAAEKRFRTQPAISAQIRSLEEEVGARLLDRTGGKVTMTAPGRAFLKYVEEALEAKRIAIASVAEIERVPSGQIVVAANEGTCLHLLPEVFAEFKQLYPDVSITVRRSESREVLEAVNENSADFGIVAMPVKDRRLTTVPIHHDELVLIVPMMHPLARKTEVDASELGQYPLLIPKVGRTRDAIEDMLHEHQIKANLSMELDSSELMKRFVAAGVGVALVAGSNVLEDVKAGLLWSCQIRNVHIRRDMALVFRTDKALSRAALAFIDITVRLKTTHQSSMHVL
jgi:DNA-binding transcriptional LysR family regulator